MTTRSPEPAESAIPAEPPAAARDTPEVSAPTGADDIPDLPPSLRPSGNSLLVDEIRSPVTASPETIWQLFVAFTLLSLQGFGGVVAVAQRVLCEERRWLGRQEFVELLALGQLLPGPNICNLALFIGDRFFGTRGALAALAGLITIPGVLVLALTVLYTQWSSVPEVAGALRGMAVVAAGITLGTAFKLAASLAPGPLGTASRLVLAIATFALVAVLRLPLAWVLLGLGATATVFAWYRIVVQSRAEPVA
jgi:chromate transporter